MMNCGKIWVLILLALLIGCRPAPDAPPAAPADEPQQAEHADNDPAAAPAGQRSGAGGGQGTGTGSGQGAGGGGGPGTGAGGGGGTGGGRDVACDDEIVLTLDGAVVWRRTRDEVAADPAVGPLAGYRDETRPVVRLGEFLSGFEGLRGIRVGSCGARSLEFNAGQIAAAPLYLERGASGRWRLVDLAKPEMPTIFIRDVVRIELSTTDGPGGGDNPG